MKGLMTGLSCQGTSFLFLGADNIAKCRAAVPLMAPIITSSLPITTKAFLPQRHAYLTCSRARHHTEEEQRQALRGLPFQQMESLGRKKKLLVSCNPTLTSCYSEKSLRYFFLICPPNSQSHKTCIKHTFLNKFTYQKKIVPTYLPYIFRNIYRKQIKKFQGLS